MKTEEAKKLADRALAELAAALAEGHSDTLTTYLETMARFHQYSWGNVLLILGQRPQATQVAGYHAWKRLGRQVKRDERAIVILAPMVYRPPATDEASEKGPANETELPVTERLVGFRPVSVFDVAQTDGQPLPALHQFSGAPMDHLDRLKGVIVQRGIELKYLDWLGGADGLSGNGMIAIRSGLAPAEEFAVLAHELAHSILHHGGEPRPESRTVRETEAEAVAFVVCHAVGLHAGSACSDYIQLYEGDKETLAGSLGRIQRTAATIIEGIQAIEEPPVRVAA